MGEDPSDTVRPMMEGLGLRLVDLGDRRDMAESDGRLLVQADRNRPGAANEEIHLPAARV